MPRTSGMALRAGVCIVVGAISGVMVAYAVKEIVHRLHGSIHSPKSLRDCDEDENADSTVGPGIAPNELNELKSVTQLANDTSSNITRHTDKVVNTRTDPSTVIIDASPQSGIRTNPPTEPPHPAPVAFYAPDASPASLSMPPSNDISDARSSPSYDLTNTTSLLGPQTAPVATTSIPGHALPPLSMPSEALPPSSDSSPTDFFSPTSSIDTFFSPLSPSQTWLKLEHGDRDEPIEGKPLQTSHEATSFIDLVPPSHIHPVAVRRAIRAHDVFAASCISFSELGSLVRSDSGVQNEEDGEEDRG